jgi:hypothetical protein
MVWQVYNGGVWINIADNSDVSDASKYSTSKNPSTGLYYRLHILNVEVSDVKKYRCDGVVNEIIQIFYLQLILLGRCNYASVIFKVYKIEGFVVVGELRILFEVRPL